MSNRIAGDLFVDGSLQAVEMVLANSSVVNATVSAAADIDASKLEQHHSKSYPQVGTAATETVVLHVIHGATARVQKVWATNIVNSIGDSTVTVDVKKNGTTVLTGVLTLDVNTGAYGIEKGTISVTAGVVDDVYTAVITATIGTGTLPTGIGVEMRIDEDYPA